MRDIVSMTSYEVGTHGTSLVLAEDETRPHEQEDAAVRCHVAVSRTRYY